MDTWQGAFFDCPEAETAVTWTPPHRDRPSIMVGYPDFVIHGVLATFIQRCIVCSVNY
jgi:hypothetical protein